MNRTRKRWNHQTGESYVPGRDARPAPARSSLPRPMVVRDFQEDVRSMADGQVYSSKRHWRDHLKAHGMVEMGNEMPAGPAIEPAITGQDIADAYDQFDAQGADPELRDRPPEHWDGDAVELAVEGK